jgi:hypothetical protein
MPRQRQYLALVPLFFGTGPGEMSGSAVIAFSETAAPSSYASTAASEAIAFSEAAALGGYNNLTANAVITFSEAAVLDAFLFGDIAASAVITFSETAALDTQIFGELAGSTVIQFTHTAKLRDASLFLPQPILPIPIPHVRTIDAKTLADHFNRGEIVTPDYEWPNTRKFYQDGSG